MTNEEIKKIPHLWYIECHKKVIVGIQESLYLCTYKFKE